MSIQPNKDARWLFIGDSITDYGRRNDPAGLGFGYVRMIQQWLSGRGGSPEVLNRGISGHTIRNLEDRWEEDVIALKPDLLSVKVGVNDVGHQFAEDRQERGVKLEEFRQRYDSCLDRFRQVCPESHLVLCEPLGMWPPRLEECNALVREYLPVIHELGAKYKADAVVNLYAAFEKALTEHPGIDWTVDGVHPSPPGDALIATIWMKSVGLCG